MPKDKTYLLTINGGSSSIKFTLYNVTESLTSILSGKLTGLGLPVAKLRVTNSIQAEASAVDIKADNYQQAVAVLIDWFYKHIDISSIKAIGHRIVHGGHLYKKPQWVTKQLLKHLSAITPLDPQHLPGEVQLIEAFNEYFPQLKQMVCFDTEFHQHLPTVAKLLPIPRRYLDQGIYRYGFHGLSYQYLMQVLHQQEGEAIQQHKIILAHLGNGASMAAVTNGQSIDTTMAMTPAAGLVMGTRSGDLDPGLYGLLNRSEGMTGEQFETMINQQSGLLGISASTSDMQQLLELRSTDPNAEDAVDVFCYQARKQIGAYAAALGGLDTLVFSGGIGENVAEIRTQICQQLAFIGIELDNELNQQNALRISTLQSRVTVWVIPTNEELMIAQSMCDLLNLNHQGEK
ncbi:MULTISPECIES: acetate/propionate family kinase [unclassified Methylophaga]|uniref:acetate/propionate family kinase n=1 Tax=unclassified Methylophaga TaxID=2629249 RepID=UPI000C8E9971|nr:MULTISPECIES: acetate/propionate family kinase [unclassified Methylophaga]MBN45463.1 acetate kinase [Methylophaga sp.]|tara:strand:- start:212636 stop:213844 length:1209 start_codon:yes stop_codon:yes gene_type:complete